MTGAGATGSDGAGFGIRLAWPACAVLSAWGEAWAVVRCPAGWFCCAVAAAGPSDVGWPDDDGTGEAAAVEFWPSGEADGTVGAGEEGFSCDVDVPGIDA